MPPEQSRHTPCHYVVRPKMSARRHRRQFYELRRCRQSHMPLRCSDRRRALRQNRRGYAAMREKATRAPAICAQNQNKECCASSKRCAMRAPTMSVCLLNDVTPLLIRLPAPSQRAPSPRCDMLRTREGDECVRCRHDVVGFAFCLHAHADIAARYFCPTADISLLLMPADAAAARYFIPREAKRERRARGDGAGAARGARRSRHTATRAMVNQRCTARRQRKTMMFCR